MLIKLETDCEFRSGYTICTPANLKTRVKQGHTQECFYCKQTLITEVYYSRQFDFYNIYIYYYLLVAL